MGTEKRQEEAEEERVMGERKAECKLCCSSRKGILSIDCIDLLQSIMTEVL